MEVKPGYQHTEIGVIPMDWNLTSLGKLVRSVEYGSAAKSDVKGAVAVLRMGNLQGGKIDWSDLVYTDDVAEIDKYMLRSGDVLFNRTNTIDLVGKTSIYEGEYPAIFAGYLIRINLVPEFLDSRFLNYILNTEFARKHGSKVLSVAVGQANINGQKLKTYPIPLPPTLEEQEEIAKALEVADGLIKSLEKLIAKKQQIKRGAMQELLTAQKRLPGFTDKWKKRRLGEGITLHSGYHVLAQHCNTQQDGVPYLTGPADFPDGRIHHTKFTTRPGTICSPRDILVTVKGSGAGRIVLADSHYCISRQLMAIRVYDWDSNFIFFSLQQNANKFRAASTGLIPGLSRSDILDQALPFPRTILEQTAIATILCDMDTEISGLEAKLAKARLVKAGMMQELLTGKTRLVKPGGIHA